MVELICLDVDGTLVGADGEVPPLVWAAAHRARARGVRIAVCSGRPAFGRARDYAARLDAAGWHVFQNGASVVHLATNESRSHALPDAAVERLIARAAETKRVLEFYSDGEYAVERDTNRARAHAALLGIPYAPRPLRSLAAPVVRAQWLLPLEEGEAVLLEPHDGLLLSPSLSPVMPDTLFVNATRHGVDKAHAVRLVAEEYGIALDHVMMVGDGRNDVAALQAVGVSDAMGNAEPEAREAARYEVSHVDEGGLVEAFELASSLG